MMLCVWLDALPGKDWRADCRKVGTLPEAAGNLGTFRAKTARRARNFAAALRLENEHLPLNGGGTNCCYLRVSNAQRKNKWKEDKKVPRDWYA